MLAVLSDTAVIDCWRNCTPYACYAVGLRCAKAKPLAYCGAGLLRWRCPCDAVYYCGVPCQRVHRRRHRPTCFCCLLDHHHFVCKILHINTRKLSKRDDHLRVVQDTTAVIKSLLRSKVDTKGVFIMCAIAPLTYVGERYLYSSGNVHQFIRNCRIVLLSSNDWDNRWVDNSHLWLITCVLDAYDGMRVVVWDRNKRRVLVHYRHPIFCKLLAFLSDYTIVRGRWRNF